MRARTKVALPRLALGALAITLLVSCSLAPPYERPPAPIPDEWKDGEKLPASSARGGSQLDWQSFVVDQTLRDLIDLALENNRDLRQTLLNVEAARAQYRISRSERLPSMGLDAASTRQRVGDAPVESSHTVGVGFTAFELDVFGRVRNLSQAAQQDYLTTERAGHTARISLVAEVIQAYLTRDGAQQRRAIAAQVLQARETSLALMAQLRSHGFASELDYHEAVGLRDQGRVELQRIDRELRQSSNALALLMGVIDADERLPKTYNGNVVLVQDIAPGMPSTLLMRRPDIRGAEHQLKARNASIGAARAAFFPRISLTGSVGSSSQELSDLFGAGTRSWSFSPQISLPLFNYGANRANLDLAHVRKDIAVAAYERSIQVAFAEVADALVATDTLKREEQAQADAAHASSQALALSEERYRRGLDGHLRFLDAQRSDFSNQMGLIEVRTQRQIALSSLFRALGGGWQGELTVSNAASTHGRHHR